MKKIILFLLIAFVSIAKSFSQNQHKIDSLLLVLKTTEADTIKVNALIAIGVELRDGDAKQSVEYQKQALALAEKINFKRGMARSHANMGGALKNLGEYDEALSHLRTAIKIAEEIKASR